MARGSLTPAWTQLRPHPQQSAAWRTKARFVSLCAGRGSGKTELARRRIVRYLSVRKRHPDPIYFYALPTYAQARRVAWEPLKRLVPKHWIAPDGVSESNMTITTVFGSKLYVVGLDKPQRVEGVQWDGCVIDESSDQRPKTFDISIRPALTHRLGWCWRIGVPKRFGVGAAEYRNFHENIAEESYSWHSSTVLPESELALARRSLTDVDYREQFEASWEIIGGSVFYAFHEGNIDRSVAYNPDREIIVGQDFNVNPMAWVLGHDIDGKFHVFEEIYRRNTNTEATLKYLASRYGQHRAGFCFHGDATARARKTSASTSDLIQIKNFSQLERSRVLYTTSNPPVVDRVQSCNCMLKPAEGDPKVLIHPRCENLLRDLRDRTWKADSREPADGPDQGHITDAFGYVVHLRWPMRLMTGTQKVVTT